MKEFTGQEKLVAKSLSVATGEAAVWKEHRQNTTKYNLKYELTRAKHIADGCAQRLLWYCQLPNTSSFPILRVICNFSQYLNIIIHLFRDFSRNPLRWSAEPWLESAGIMCIKQTYHI
jgi:hypothetical protein